MSATNANAWLRAIPTVHNDLAFSRDASLITMVARSTYPSADSKCPLCSSALDPDCHHALTCRSGGDTIAQHNKLRDCFANNI